jgi:dissimilatory sulfite reductase (desulfoviridin) alpha/beta subunit
LIEQIDLAVRASAWWPRVMQRNGKVPSHHPRLRVALAGCPNACTMPQIRDIGIIATVTPQAVRPECNGCGGCERTCREEAIVVRAGRAVLDEDRCVGCGQCIESCPIQAIDPGPVRLRVLVGGRMGRHPRWAEDLCEVDVASVAEVVKLLLDGLAGEALPAEQMADAVQRITIECLRRNIASALPAPACVESARQACPVGSGSESSVGLDRNRG